MSALAVVSPGLHTTVQDLGRWGYQAQGVPVAGTLDPVALRLANALVGNGPAEAGLEIRGFGPSLRVEADSVRIAVCGGARLGLSRSDAAVRLECDRAHVLLRGDVLSIGALEGGIATAVLAVAGGFDLTPVLGSLSTYVPAAIGPLGGRPLAAGGTLPLRRDRDGGGPCLRLARPFDYGAGPIRLMEGPQAEAFTATALDRLYGGDYRVGAEADRMGMRLDGPPLAHRAGAGIASDGLVSGCIQVPGNGQPIILLADHQTVGGYAKIATAISADLPRLGRMAAGTSLRFRRVDSDEAAAARRRLEHHIAAAVAGLRPVSDGLDLAALYSANLVSGMVKAEP